MITYEMTVKIVESLERKIEQQGKIIDRLLALFEQLEGDPEKVKRIIKNPGGVK